jgi:stearoyl-CoA desaturase (delta-9 desaturase)
MDRRDLYVPYHVKFRGETAKARALGQRLHIRRIYRQLQNYYKPQSSPMLLSIQAEAAKNTGPLIKGDRDMESILKRDKTFSQPVNWVTSFFMLAFHIGAVAALFFFSWKAVLMAVFLWWVAGSLGIGMGYHRLLTHRGYKTPKWVEYFLTVCATLALEGGPIFWVATHRRHHQNTDKEGDPHSPRDGGLWAHMGWIMTGKAMHNKRDSLLPYVPDLRKDKFHVWISEYHWITQVVVGVALLYFGGLPFLLWGSFVRTVFGLHSTWLVNSATHMWGSQRFITGDDSTNSFWVAVLTFGEGWHNNHHAHPQMARHGMTWYEIDMNWYGISALKAMGLAWDISLPKLGRDKGIKPLAVPETPGVIAPVVADAIPQEAEGD